MLLATVEAALFDATHIWYMVLSAAASVGLLVLAHLYLKTQKQKDSFLKFWALITVALHYSSLWVDFFKDGDKTIGENMLFAIYPCNICMWLLFAVSLIRNKESLVFKILAEFVFWGGTVCGIIGIVLNENYVGSIGLADYEIFKGLISHSTMVMGALYLLVGKYVKIRVFNVISVAVGLTIFIVNGTIINTLYEIFEREPCNSMYLQEPPFDNMPWFNTLLIGVIAISVCFIITAIYEQIALKKEERWYTRLKQLFLDKFKKA